MRQHSHHCSNRTSSLRHVTASRVSRTPASSRLSGRPNKGLDPDPSLRTQPPPVNPRKSTSGRRLTGHSSSFSDSPTDINSDILLESIDTDPIFLDGPCQQVDYLLRSHAADAASGYRIDNTTRDMSQTLVI